MKAILEIFSFDRNWMPLHHRNNRIQKKWRRNGSKRGPDFLARTHGMTFVQIDLPGLLTKEWP